MGKSSMSFHFLQNLQNKEAYFETIIDEKHPLKRILKQFLLMNLLGFIYGIVMGCYNGFFQAISSGIKLPILFSLVIIICFPAFFIIQFVIGSRLSFAQMLTIIISSFTLINAIMVSFSTIVLFFLITGNNYSFLKLLHFAVFVLSAIFGMITIIEALKFSCEKKNIYPKTGVKVFYFWIIIIGFVGLQLGWSLRPFIGSKEEPFEIFRKKGGNIYQSLIGSLIDMFDGKDVSSGVVPEQENVENMELIDE